MVSVESLCVEFGLDLGLSKSILDFNIDGDFKGFDLITRELWDNGLYSVFDVYHFEDEDSFVEIVPLNVSQTLIVGSKLNGLWNVYSFNSEAELSVSS